MQYSSSAPIALVIHFEIRVVRKCAKREVGADDWKLGNTYPVHIHVLLVLCFLQTRHRNTLGRKPFSRQHFSSPPQIEPKLYGP